MTFDFMTANGSLGWNPGNAQHNTAPPAVNAHCACDVCTRARTPTQLTDAEFLSKQVKTLSQGATGWYILFQHPDIAYVSASTVEEVIAAARAKVAEHEAKGAPAECLWWKGLNDVQWMNIVNHERAYENYSKEDAVNRAVGLTEAKLKEINGLKK